MNKKKIYCKKCGSVIDNESGECTGCGKQYFRIRKLFSSKVLIWLLVIACTGLAGCSYFWYSGCIYQQQKNAELEKESKRNSDQVNTLTDKIASLEKDNDKLLEDFGHASFEAYWYETNVAICTPTGKKYHSYDCSHWKDSDYVYIFSIADAESRGYEPCSDCQ